jgi:hypothetical protein
MVVSILMAFAFCLSGCVAIEKAHRTEPVVIKNTAVGLNFLDLCN